MFYSCPFHILSILFRNISIVSTYVIVRHLSQSVHSFHLLSLSVHCYHMPNVIICSLSTDTYLQLPAHCHYLSLVTIRPLSSYVIVIIRRLSPYPHHNYLSIVIMCPESSFVHCHHLHIIVICTCHLSSSVECHNIRCHYLSISPVYVA